jgi:hypothetical protein
MATANQAHRLRVLPGGGSDVDPPAAAPDAAAPGSDPWWRVDGAAAPAAHPATGDSDFRSAGGPVDPGRPPQSPWQATGHEPGRPQATGHGATDGGATVAVAPPETPGPAVGAELEVSAAGVAGMVHHWTGMAAARPGGLLHSLVADSPPSAAEHLGYVGSGAWLPPGHPGGASRLAGQTYGYTLGLLGVTIGNGIAWTFHKPMRLLLVALIAGFLTLIGIVCM